RLDDVGDHVGNAQAHARLHGAVQVHDRGRLDALLRQVLGHERRVRRRDPPPGDVRDLGDRLLGADGRRVPERRAREPEAEVLDGVGARVEHEVTPGDAHVDGARPDVHRDVTRAQEEELDVVLGVGEHELAGVTALAVARLAQHLGRGPRQGALVGDGDAQHGWFLSGCTSDLTTRLSRRRSDRWGRTAPGPGHRCVYTSSRVSPLATIRICRWSSSCEFSSAVSVSGWYSAAIETSAASSTTFLPIAWTPASSWATVPEPAGRVRAFSVSSANRVSKVFTGPA